MKIIRILTKISKKLLMENLKKKYFKNKKFLAIKINKMISKKTV
jgi:hypothetical protein